MAIIIKIATEDRIIAACLLSSNCGNSNIRSHINTSGVISNISKLAKLKNMKGIASKTKTVAANALSSRLIIFFYILKDYYVLFGQVSHVRLTLRLLANKTLFNNLLRGLNSLLFCRSAPLQFFPVVKEDTL